MFEEIKKELKKIGMTDFDDYDFFESDESLTYQVKENGYKQFGDAKTNNWAIEKTLKDLKAYYEA